MREPISACLSPSVCGKLIFRFLEVNEMRAKITHSLEDELKVAELFGANWFWQWNWQKTCLTHLGSDPICDGLARSSKTLCQTGSKGPHSWSPNSTDFSISHRLWLSICLTNIRGEMQGNQLGTTHWPGSLIGRHQDNYKTRPNWGIFTNGYRQCAGRMKKGNFYWGQFHRIRECPCASPNLAALA